MLGLPPIGYPCGGGTPYCAGPPKPPRGAKPPRPPPRGPLSEALSTRIALPSNLSVEMLVQQLITYGAIVGKELIVLDVVHGCDRFLGVLLLGVPNESEPTATAGISVLDYHLYIE